MRQRQIKMPKRFAWQKTNDKAHRDKEKRKTILTLRQKTRRENSNFVTTVNTVPRHH